MYLLSGLLRVLRSSMETGKASMTEGKNGPSFLILPSNATTEFKVIGACWW